MRHDDDGHALAGGIAPTALFPEPPPPSEVASRATAATRPAFSGAPLVVLFTSIHLYLVFSFSITLYLCLCSIAVTVTALLPTRLCRLAVFLVKPTFSLSPIKLEGETENMGVCTKERKGVAAAVLMATPCTNSLGGDSGGQKHEGCGGRSACWKYAA